MEGRENEKKGGKKEERNEWLSGFWTFFVVWCLKQAQKVRLLPFQIFILILPQVKKRKTCGVTSSVQPAKNQNYPSPLFCMRKDTGSISITSHMLTLVRFEDPHALRSAQTRFM